MRKSDRPRDRQRCKRQTVRACMCACISSLLLEQIDARNLSRTSITVVVGWGTTSINFGSITRGYIIRCTQYIKMYCGRTFRSTAVQSYPAMKKTESSGQTHFLCKTGLICWYKTFVSLLYHLICLRAGSMR